MKLLQNRQTDIREMDSLTMFLFGSEKTDKGIPAKEGWTQRVDRTLEEILSELRPDHNGRHNLRGIVERGAEAAGAEVVRVRKNEDDANDAT